MTTANLVSASGLLVVEGRADEHLVRHLCQRADPQLAARFNIYDAHGVNGVLKTVRGYSNRADLSSVGFMVDADSDPVQRWREVADRIAAANSAIPLPSGPEANGSIIPADSDIGNPRIGIWVMPDNTSPGELEDFVRQMIPPGDPVWPRAQDYINDIPVNVRRFANDQITKNQVHAWLAAGRYPGIIGLAVRESDLNVEAELPRRFLSWLARLFN